MTLKNNKNKIAIFLIVPLVILLIVLLTCNNKNSTGTKKLSADITYPTSTGVKFNCEATTIAVNESTTCTLTGYREGGIYGVSGYYTATEGLTVSAEVNTEIFSPYVGTDPAEMMYFEKNYRKLEQDQFIIATFTLTGASAGVKNLTFTNLSWDEHPFFMVEDSSGNPNAEDYFSDQTVAITVTSDTPTPPSVDSDDNTLSSITIDGAAIPNFTSNNLNYEYTVNSSKTYVTIVANVNESHASVVSGDGRQDLTGNETIVNIKVKAQNNSEKTYQVKIKKQGSTEPATQTPKNTLSSLSITNATLSPKFNKDVTDYNATIENSVTTIKINATAEDTTATVIGAKQYAPKVGENVYTVEVKSSDNKTKVYKR